ncbi:Protein pxr1 [Schizosaccharomyces pombe]|uniref:Protein pxr1 n=1 Tax=Schizosaccharomyces pombe (strain 972 / ATCC 24843) TaxID=284812 RepID=PXR1_SCHPO|nr:putative PINX1 family ribosome biogenesis protein [Schizosaccharomyces pombe]Q9URX9.1 RecName: Full=Protein pxr1; AltName: Full=PinX1-related protein 1 [Schizosaccharomyces pombe 972h-]CAB63496.1 ribosome biogenesis protein, G-pathc domain, PINX1 family (predicted) [Schizosaccharomyces pombe]|eukprot:NP_594823.1 putative PINX1 family ribosome biogenesis protein [Schizosaccharomyces pombe]
MGLAGVKKKQQIGVDPRNSKWAKDTNRLGFKLLSSYGWVNGNGLGEKQHGRIHNIKVSLKDDTLGIGAKATNDLEWSGLGEFNAIFGRLNGDESAYGVYAEKAKVQQLTYERQSANEKGLKSLELSRRFVLGGTFTSEFSEWMQKAEEDEDRVCEDASSSDEAKREKRKKHSSKKKSKKKTSTGSALDPKKLEKITKKKKKEHKKKDKESSSKKRKSGSSDKEEKKKKKIKLKDKPESTSSVEKVKEGNRPASIHFHTRRKFLAQKRAAVSDPVALREILGIKG